MFLHSSKHSPYISLYCHACSLCSLYFHTCSSLFLICLYIFAIIPCVYIYKYVYLYITIHILNSSLYLHEYSIYLLTFPYMFQMLHYVSIHIPRVSLDVHTYSLCLYNCKHIPYISSYCHTYSLDLFYFHTCSL